MDFIHSYTPICEGSQVKALITLLYRYTINQKMAKTSQFKNATNYAVIPLTLIAAAPRKASVHTGIHDAVNLGWKLLLQIRGFKKPEILQT